MLFSVILIFQIIELSILQILQNTIFNNFKFENDWK